MTKKEWKIKKGDKMFKFNFYDVLKDKVSGFSGVCLARTEYATGCIHYGLLASKLNKEGKPFDNYEWFDTSRLILVKKSKKTNKNKTGGLEHNAPSF